MSILEKNNIDEMKLNKTDNIQMNGGCEELPNRIESI
jgi:hypothetical protein